MGNQWSTFIETPETPFSKAVVMFKGLGGRIAVLDFEHLFLEANYEPLILTSFNAENKQAAVDELVSHLNPEAVEFTRALLTHGIGVTLTVNTQSANNGNVVAQDKGYEFAGKPLVEQALVEATGGDVTSYIQVVEVTPQNYWTEVDKIVKSSGFRALSTLIIHHDPKVVIRARKKHRMLAMLTSCPLFDH